MPLHNVSSSRPRTAPLSAALLAAALLLAMAACSGDNAACTSARDCFAGEVCVNNTCRTSAGPGDGADTGRNDAGNGGTEDVSDRTRPDTAGPDAGDEPVERACVVDPFTVACADPETRPHNAKSDAILLNRGAPIGCVHDDTPVLGVDVSHEGRLCPGELADWFSVNTTECTTARFIVEYTLTLDEPCDSDLVELAVDGYPCDSEDVLCETLAPGTKRITIRSATYSHRTLAYHYVSLRAADGVTGARADRAVSSGYTLRVVAR